MRRRRERPRPWAPGAAACGIALVLAAAAGGCATMRRLDAMGVERACAVHCEEFYERCRSACPRRWGTTLGCTLSQCNPQRTTCLERCGPAR